MTYGKLSIAQEFLYTHCEYINCTHHKFILKSSRADKIYTFLLALTTLGLVFFLLFLWIDGMNKEKEANQKTLALQNVLAKNLISYGVTLRTKNNNPLKAKLLFAKAVKYSSKKKQKIQAKILYNTVQKYIYEHQNNITKAILSKDRKTIICWYKDGT